MTPAIRIEHLSKKYRIGARRSRYRTLRETLSDGTAAAFRRLRGTQRDEQTENGTGSLWALKDVSFEVRPGEVLGIIGRNGAGKSTLLKILSRITEPTEGRVAVRGRIGSLLEVGTGFHPELTGRENIYLNGAILGMRREEIERKFDDIVAFADISQMLETPVKRYSSGMYVRLAFAVAAHLEPEILVVDEVLAVGDFEFQKKCLNKMQDIGSQGRTVLFVSHNLSALQTLCTRGILLQAGKVLTHQPIGGAVDAYLQSIEKEAQTDLATRTDRRGRGRIRLERVCISMGPSCPDGTLAMGRPAQFIFELNQVKKGVYCSFTIYDQRGRAVANLDSWRRGDGDRSCPDISNCFICRMDELVLRPGRYCINTLVMNNSETEDQIDGAAFFDVEAGQYRGRSYPYASTPGVVSLDHIWLSPW
jgi:lipopolysaccharide transport system ATP-binding protein